ncbi:Dihydrofolate reductase [Rhodococcus sp. WAY2]|nr:Dihydrofolate reductase [Rhodococcus sp. WAY2]
MLVGIIVARVGKLIYSFLASLDGYIADLAGAFDWAVPDEEVLDFINVAEREVGTYLYGRTMYEMMTGWENDPAVAAQSPMSAEFAQIWQAAEKVVFSRSLDSVSTTRTRIERTFDPGLVRDLKASTAQDLNVSGATLAASAWKAQLIDECHLYLAPMLVGGGKRMFPDDIRHSLELLDERRFGNGMVFLRYAVQT